MGTGCLLLWYVVEFFWGILEGGSFLSHLFSDFSFPSYDFAVFWVFD